LRPGSGRNFDVVGLAKRQGTGGVFERNWILPEAISAG
jgi:hypothetical protein